MISSLCAVIAIMAMPISAVQPLHNEENPMQGNVKRSNAASSDDGVRKADTQKNQVADHGVDHAAVRRMGVQVTAHGKASVAAIERSGTEMAETQASWRVKHTAKSQPKPKDGVKEWLKKFQSNDCAQVTSALNSEEATAVQNEQLCDGMWDGLGICIQGCPGMGFRCLKRMSCQLANDTTADAKIKQEAVKVCTKMETVAQESATESECTESSLIQHRTGKGKGEAIQDRYLECFPDSTDSQTDNDDYDGGSCGGNLLEQGSLLEKMSIRASSSSQTSDHVLDESLTGKELC